ncbi:hypothetical protein [Bacillus fonticola]|uniref:hypothetical protein n=1 Tax=Bacillus fonticola TaxID=2728853 RepID=UPI0014757D38|nr:hypothetical protein [Bacillus fonticola]
MIRMIGFELRKIFSQKMLWAGVVLLGALAYLVFSITFTNPRPDLTDEYAPYEGKVTDELIAKIKEDETTLRSQYGEEELFKLGKMSVFEQFSWERSIQVNLEEEAKLLDFSIAKASGSEKASLQLHKKMLNEVNVDEFVYFNGPEEVVDYVNTFHFVFVAFLLLLGLSGVFSNDAQWKTEPILFSSRYGRSKHLNAKISAAILFTIIVVSASEILNLTLRFLAYGTTGWEAPVQAIFKYTTSPYAWTMGEYHLVQLGVSLLGALGLALVILLISTLFPNTFLAFVVSSLLFGIPLILAEFIMVPEDSLARLIQDYSFMTLLRVEELFMQFEAIVLFGQPILTSIWIPAVVTAVSVIALALLCLRVKRKQVHA